MMATKPLRPCNKVGCNKLTDSGYCDEHTKVIKRQRFERDKELKKNRDKRYDKFKRNKQSKSFYDSDGWRAVRQLALRRDRNLCVLCFNHKRMVKADVVDHIIPIQVDWSKRLLLNNLQSLCHACHNRKTRDDEIKYNRVGAP